MLKGPIQQLKLKVHLVLTLHRGMLDPDYLDIYCITKGSGGRQ